jgi:hypothetical protein
MTTPQPDKGITNTGPETVNISGAAIGSRGGPAGPSRTVRSAPERTVGPSLRNEGVLNLGRGQINMENCVTGPGATMHIGGGRPEAAPVPEPEADLNAEPEPEAEL